MNQASDAALPMTARIDRLLAARVWAVVGASSNTEKYGYKVFRDLLDFGRTVYAVNPSAGEIDGKPVYTKLADLPETPDAVAVIVPPSVTERVVPEIVSSGAIGVWMQPGAESYKAMAEAQTAGLMVVGGGPCLLVALRTRPALPPSDAAASLDTKDAS